MDINKILEVLLRWVHVGAASYWLAVGFYTWQIMRAELQIDGATFTSYAAQIRRVSKLGMGMAISSGMTVLVGIFLYGVVNYGYWNRGFNTLGSMIFHLGVIVGVVASAHGGMVFGRAERELAGILQGVAGAPTESQISSFRSASASMLSKIPLHFALVAVAFLCMIAGAAIP